MMGPRRPPTRELKQLTQEAPSRFLKNAETA
jgi:hypothetical protein